MGRSREITGLAASIVTLLTMGVAVAQHATISSWPTFDCEKAKATLALLICSGEETARADWDFKIAHWARYFSLDEDDRAAFLKDDNKWAKSLEKQCRLSGPPFSRQQTSCVIDAYKKRATLHRSKLSGGALAESKMTPEQLSQIQQALITLGFFHGEADGEFGPLTRAAIRRYREANGFPQSDFLSIAQSQALLEGRTARSPPRPSPPRQAAPVQGTPPSLRPRNRRLLRRELPFSLRPYNRRLLRRVLEMRRPRGKTLHPLLRPRRPRRRRSSSTSTRIGNNP